MKKIGIVMGSDSDLAVAEKAANTLKELGVPFEVHVYSAHRTPVEAAEFSKTAREKGFGAIRPFPEPEFWWSGRKLRWVRNTG